MPVIAPVGNSNSFSTSRGKHKVKYPNKSEFASLKIRLEIGKDAETANKRRETRANEDNWQYLITFRQEPRAKKQKNLQIRGVLYGNTEDKIDISFLRLKNE